MEIRPYAETYEFKDHFHSKNAGEEIIENREIRIRNHTFQT
jgi:hypothetical protein